MDLEKIYRLITNELAQWVKEFIRLLPYIALAVIVLVIGLFLAKKIRNLALRLIRKVSHIETINNLFASFIHILSIGITFFVVLSLLQLDKAVTSILAGAGILGIALAFAFQDIAANFMSGIFLSFRRPLNVGDLVKLNDYLGRVEAINLRDTSLITLQGQRIIIPNKEVFQNPIENYTSTHKRRLDITVGVSYGDDLAKVKAVTLDALSSIKERDPKEEITFYYKEFGDSSINFDVRLWLNSPQQAVFLQARSETIMAIKQAYDEHGITIPFPIRTLDFGIKGGEKLSDMQVDLGQHTTNDQANKNTSAT